MAIRFHCSPPPKLSLLFLPLEIVMLRNVESLHRQPEADMMPAMVARREGVVVDARNLMTLRVNRIVDDIVNARVWNLIARLKKVSNFCHLVFLLLRGKRIEGAAILRRAQQFSKSSFSPSMISTDPTLVLSNCLLGGDGNVSNRGADSVSSGSVQTGDSSIGATDVWSEVALRQILCTGGAWFAEPGAR
jgi:hypothetical protein